MKILFIGRLSQIPKKTIEDTISLLSQQTDYEIHTLFYEDKTFLPCSVLEDYHANLIVTFHLAGFEQQTLTGNISYNLMDCKFLHLLLHENLPLEPFLKNPLSLSMFFYCVGEDYQKYLKLTYPHLPYLKALIGWDNKDSLQASSNNAQLLKNAIQEVIQECFCY